MSKESPEDLAVTRKYEERKSRGRRRMLRMSSFTNWLEESRIKHEEVELLQKIKKIMAVHDRLHSRHGTLRTKGTSKTIFNK